MVGVHFFICASFIYRYFILRKVPTLRKFLCAMVVLISLFICLIPKIFTSVDPDAADSTGGASGVAGILWPLCFMLGFVRKTLVRFILETDNPSGRRWAMNDSSSDNLSVYKRAGQADGLRCWSLQTNLLS